MVGWDQQLNGHGFGRTLGVGDGPGGLACCGSWGHKELDTTELTETTIQKSTAQTHRNLVSVTPVADVHIVSEFSPLGTRYNR